jgi:hypothetical protein
VLTGTPYEPLDGSDIWTYGTGLGPTGQILWRTIAALAVARGSEEIQASRRYLCIKLGGVLTDSGIGKLMSRMVGHGLLTRLNQRTGRYLVHPLSREEVAALEDRLGVTGRRQKTIREARQGSEAYKDWLAELFERHGDIDAALTAWDPAK